MKKLIIPILLITLVLTACSPANVSSEVYKKGIDFSNSALGDYATKDKDMIVDAMRNENKLKDEIKNYNSDEATFLEGALYVSELCFVVNVYEDEGLDKKANDTKDKIKKLCKYLKEKDVWGIKNILKSKGTS